MDEVWSTIHNDLPFLRVMLPELRTLVARIGEIG